MVGPVQFSNNSKIYFRGENEDLINAPGKFQQQSIPETPDDEITLSNKPAEEEKKSSTGKTIAKVIGGIVVLAGALFGAYKWKGDKWLNKEATGTTAKIKNWLMKPGEYMEKGFKRLKKALGFGKEAPKTDNPSNANNGETPKPNVQGNANNGETPKPNVQGNANNGETPKPNNQNNANKEQKN